MRYGRRQQNVRDYSSSHVLNAVKEKMMNRWFALAPCPIAPMDIYRILYTKDEVKALRTLRARYPTLLREDSSLEVQWNCDAFKLRHPLVNNDKHAVVPTVLNVDMPHEVPLPSTNGWRSGADKVLLSNFPDGLRSMLIDWAKVWIQRAIEYGAVAAKVEACFQECNTMGQIKRVWPNLCSFLPNRAQEILRNAKVQSKLPEGVIDRDADDKVYLIPQWRPEALHPFDTLLTQALILPERDRDDGDWKLRVIYTQAP